MPHITQDEVDHLAHLRRRQRELFRGDRRLLEFTHDEPLTVSIGELLKVKGA